ncbi:hypothetical protein J6590_070062 [Homalodisca vitripennis]|nr:hypothetical protein J6590_070062 [Homalodisca vitripennis]
MTRTGATLYGKRTNGVVLRVQRLSQDNRRIKQRQAWLLLGCVTPERSCPCKQPACPAVGGGSEVIFKLLVPRLSVREGFLALTSPGIIRLLFLLFTFNQTLGIVQAF